MEFNFKLTEQEAQIVLNALLKEPYGVVADVINKIQVQASEQIKAKEVSTQKDKITKQPTQLKST